MIEKDTFDILKYGKCQWCEEFAATFTGTCPCGKLFNTNEECKCCDNCYKHCAELTDKIKTIAGP